MRLQAPSLRQTALILSSRNPAAFPKSGLNGPPPKGLSKRYCSAALKKNRNWSYAAQVDPVDRIPFYSWIVRWRLIKAQVDPGFVVILLRSSLP